MWIKPTTLQSNADFEGGMVKCVMLWWKSLEKGAGFFPLLTNQRMSHQEVSVLVVLQVMIAQVKDEGQIISRTFKIGSMSGGVRAVST